MSGPIANNPVYKTPCEHGGVFFAPKGHRMLADLLANQCRLDGGPLGAIRSAVRSELLDLARQWRDHRGLEYPVCDREMPLVATGHQVGLWHAGIFIKYLLADRLARQVGGAVFNIIVDNDLPSHTKFQWPYRSGDTLECLTVDTLEGGANVPVEYQRAPEPDVLRGRFAPMMQQSCGHECLGRVIAAIMDAADGGDHSLVDFFIHLTEPFMRTMTAPRLDLPVSVMAESEGFWRFFTRILADAARFVDVYNTTLRQYRRDRNVRNPLEPVPDMAVTNDRIELPFWLFDPKRQCRIAMTAFMVDGRMVALGDAQHKYIDVRDVSCDDWQVLRQIVFDAGFAIRPRALALTMFVRLFLGDTFIHGIGGAVYDQVTDAIITDYFCMSPPAMICTSATLRLDTGPYDTPEVLETLDRQRRGLRRDRYFNPQRHIESPDAVIADLLRQRQAAVSGHKELAASRDNPTERRRVFRTIRQCNAAIWERQKQWQQDDRQQRADIIRRAHDSGIAHSREYFFGLFADEDLKQLDKAISFD